MSHQCHAKGCTKEVEPRMLMCYQHWKMVPKGIQDQIWLHYRPGQEIDKNPTKEYLRVMESAINAVAIKEHR